MNSMEENAYESGSNVVPNSESKSKFVWVRILIEFIFYTFVDIGTTMWLVELVRQYRYFSYALLTLVIEAIIALTIAFFLGVRAVDILKDRKKAVDFLRVCAVVFLFVLILVVSKIISLKDLNPRDRAAIAHKAYSSNMFFYSREEALKALTEAIGEDSTNSNYHIQRGDLYVEIFQQIKNDNNNGNVPIYDYTGDECLRNAVSDYSYVILSRDLINDKAMGQVFYKRAVVFGYMGSEYSNDALEDMKEALKTDDNNADYCLEYAKRLLDVNTYVQTESLKEEYKSRCSLAISFLGKYASIMSNIENRTPHESDYYKYYLKALQSIDDEEIKRDGLEDYIQKIVEVLAINDSAGNYGTDVLNNESNDLFLHENISNLKSLIANNDQIADDIFKNLRAEVEKENASPILLFEYGNLLRSADKFSEAEEYLTRSITKNPTFCDAYKMRSLVYNNLKRYEEAIQDVSNAIKLKETPDCFRCLADYCYNNEEYEQAIMYYQQAIVREPEYSAYCHFSIGQAYYRIDSYEQASMQFESAISDGLPQKYKMNCYREWGDVNYLLGKDMHSKNKESEATKLFKSAVENYRNGVQWSQNDKQRAFCHYWAGNANSIMGDYKSALEDYDRAVEFNDNSTYRSARDICREKLNSLT